MVGYFFVVDLIRGEVPLPTLIPGLAYRRTPYLRDLGGMEILLISEKEGAKKIQENIPLYASEHGI